MPNESHDNPIDCSEIFLSRAISSCGMSSLARRFPSIATLMKTSKPAHKKNAARKSRKSHFRIRLNKGDREATDEF